MRAVSKLRNAETLKQALGIFVSSGSYPVAGKERFGVLTFRRFGVLRFGVGLSMIKTKNVTDRRVLRFARMEDILRDAEWLDGQAEAGRALRATGNWTPPQVLDHVTKMIMLSFDGFPPDARPPLPVRMLLKMLKSSALIKPMKPGIKLRGRMAEAFAPDPQVTWGQAVTRLRNGVARVKKGDRMTAVNPAFGVMVHEEWMQFHCRHAELHLSFIHGG
jgi:hypothetical protein